MQERAQLAVADAAVLRGGRGMGRRNIVRCGNAAEVISGLKQACSASWLSRSCGPHGASAME